MLLRIHIAFIVLLLLLYSFGSAQNVVVKSPVRFLALGDSYTIGQGVVEEDRWPNQLMAALVERGAQNELLTNIARTGWTTDDLMGGIGGLTPDPPYNLVSLLIGVNNQFQGKNIDDYDDEFIALLERAIAFCGGDKSGVFVLSIPDYGYTPFGASDQERISIEIDQYNAMNRQIAQNMDVAYFDITPISREVISKPNYLAADNLHPSGDMYARWVQEILQKVRIEFLTSNQSTVRDLIPLKVYPNPSKDQVYFETTAGIRKIRIYNVLGEKVWESRELSSNNVPLQLSEWSKGVYVYRVELSNEEQLTGRFVKQ